jgi:hypothetical protein
MKVLFKCDCIELVETLPRRGAVEHIYKLKGQGAIGSATWKEVPPSLRTHFAGTAESREGSGVTWLPLNVDEQGWKELRRVLGNVEKRFWAVADKSADRMESPRDGIPVIVAVAAFEIASGEDVDPS